MDEEERKEIEDIGLEQWERHDYSEGDYGIDEKEKEKIDSFSLVVDYMQDTARRGFPPPFLGRSFFVAALNTDIVLDFTTPVGECLNIYWSYVFQQPKWAYNIAKVSESMEVWPVHADAYNLFIAQRNKIEGQIKQGLASAMDALKDYELLAHDARRYKEILDYFKQGIKDGSEHVLRSLFVDRVDAHTGEGYSMITMAKRWPTIITDFIRMGQKKHRDVEWTTDAVRKKLDVSQAEATVLITKDRLFQQWKKMFRPTVAERYARIKAVADARKSSIDTYRNWLRPYVTRHKLMKETGEDKGTGWVNSAYNVPAFGGASAVTGVRLWVWKAFPIGEKRKPLAKTENSIDEIPWMVDPYDDVAKEWIRKIEYKYRLEPGYYDETRIRGMLRKFADVDFPLQAESAVKKMVPSELYYVLFDINMERIVSKTPPPAGGEIEDLMINPMRTWIVSQNIILVHLVELDAKSLKFEREIEEMIGSRNAEKDILNKEKAVLLGKKEEVKKIGSAKRIMDNVRGKNRWVRKRLDNYSRYFFRPGPYESVFYERVVKMYLVEVGGFYKQQVDFWKSKFGVG